MYQPTRQALNELKYEVECCAFRATAINQCFHIYYVFKWSWCISAFYATCIVSVMCNDNDTYIDTYNMIFETLCEIAEHTPQSSI
jgi:hypothetical protein